MASNYNDNVVISGILGVDCPSASFLAQAEILDIIRLELQPH